jgi:hypothetical protein
MIKIIGVIMNKSILLLLSLSVNCLGFNISFDTSKLDLKFYGAYYQDLYITSCKLRGVEYTNTSYYTIPNLDKNFVKASEYIVRDFKKFQAKHTIEGLCSLEFRTDLIKNDGTKTNCTVKMNREEINLDQNISLPNDEFCK